MCGILRVAQRVALQLVAEDDGQRREHQCDAQRDRNRMADGGALLGQEGDRPNGQDRSRDTAAGQQAGDAPIDVAFLGMHGRAAGFGDGCVEQVGANRGGRMHAKEQHQQRRHERAAANASQADDSADNEAGNGIEPVHEHLRK